MKVVQVFEVGIVLEIDDQSEPVAVREIIEHALASRFAKDLKENGVKWPVNFTVAFKMEFLRRGHALDATARGKAQASEGDEEGVPAEEGEEGAQGESLRRPSPPADRRWGH